MTQTETGLKLEITRVIRASRARVFAAWTKPELVQRWFAPGNMTVPSAKVDARVGGAYEIEMRGSTAACEGSATDGDMSKRAVARGTYQRVVENELLEFTWCGDWDLTETSMVTVTLRDVEGGTELTLRHEQFATERSRNSHEHGWTGSLAKLEKAMEA
jgi:uncharacterized protein YndB with AHSA1/START domain